MSVSYLARLPFSFFFFFNDTATTEIYTLSLHDALPIWMLAGFLARRLFSLFWSKIDDQDPPRQPPSATAPRSEEHTSELQSHLNLVCRLLLEKKKKLPHQQNYPPPPRPQTQHSQLTTLP